MTLPLTGEGNLDIIGVSETTWQGDDSTNPIHAYSGGADIVVLKLAGARLFYPLFNPRKAVN